MGSVRGWSLFWHGNLHEVVMSRQFSGSGWILFPDPTVDYDCDTTPNWFVTFSVKGSFTPGVRYTSNGDGWPDEYEDERTIDEVKDEEGNDVSFDIWGPFEEIILEAVYESEFEEDEYDDPRDEYNPDDDEEPAF